MMISNAYNDSLLRRYASSTNASGTQMFNDCGTNNVLMPEGKSLGCIHHVVMECFKHTSISGRGNRDNTNKSNSNCCTQYCLSASLYICISQSIYGQYLCKCLKLFLFIWIHIIYVLNTEKYLLLFATCN